MMMFFFFWNLHPDSTMHFFSIFMWSFLLLIHYTMADDLTLMNPQAQEDVLASPPNFLPDDLPGETSSNHFTASGWTSDIDPELESQITNHESLFLAGNDIGNCDNGAEHSNQGFLPRRSRRSLTRFNKRRDPDFCIIQQPKQFVQPQESPGDAIPENSKMVPLMGPGQKPEELRRLLNSFPGTNGPSNELLCKIDSKPLHQVPVCAPRYAETSPAAVLIPCRFCKSESFDMLSLHPFIHPDTANVLRGKKIPFFCHPRMNFCEFI